FDQNNLAQGPLYTIPVGTLTNAWFDPRGGGFFGLAAYHQGLDALFLTYIDYRNRPTNPPPPPPGGKKQCITRLDCNGDCTYRITANQCFPYLPTPRGPRMPPTPPVLINDLVFFGENSGANQDGSQGTTQFVALRAFDISTGGLVQKWWSGNLTNCIG